MRVGLFIGGLWRISELQTRKAFECSELTGLSSRSLEEKIAKNNEDSGAMVQRGMRIFVLTQLGLFVDIFAKNLCAWDWRNGCDCPGSAPLG